jgi:hypothetical protein
LKNRVFSSLVSFVAAESHRTGKTKKDIAAILGRDPSQITRWLAFPSNMTLETISDILLAFDAEPDPLPIVRFSDRKRPNYAHPLIARLTGAIPNQQSSERRTTSPAVPIKSTITASGGTSVLSVDLGPEPNRVASKPVQVSA